MSQLFAWGSQSTGISALVSSPSKEHPGLISFRMDWLDLLTVQGTLKSLLQHHSSKASILQCSAFFQRRQWHPTPVLLPGESHGWRSLVGCSPWGRYESDMTEQLHFHVSVPCIGKGNGNPSTVLACRIPGTGAPDGLPSMGSHRVGHDWSDLAAAAAAFFIIQLSHPYMTTGKTIALTRWTFVGKVMSLLFNMLSRLVTTFLPRSTRLLI